MATKFDVEVDDDLSEEEFAEFAASTTSRKAPTVSRPRTYAHGNARNKEGAGRAINSSGAVHKTHVFNKNSDGVLVKKDGNASNSGKRATSKGDLLANGAQEIVDNPNHVHHNCIKALHGNDVNSGIVVINVGNVAWKHLESIYAGNAKFQSGNLRNYVKGSKAVQEEFRETEATSSISAASNKFKGTKEKPAKILLLPTASRTEQRKRKRSI